MTDKIHQSLPMRTLISKTERKSSAAWNKTSFSLRVAESGFMVSILLPDNGSHSIHIFRLEQTKRTEWH